MHSFLSVLDYACDMISCLKFLSPSDIPTQPGEQKKNFQKGLISGNPAAALWLILGAMVGLDIMSVLLEQPRTSCSGASRLPFSQNAFPALPESTSPRWSQGASLLLAAQITLMRPRCGVFMGT